MVPVGEREDAQRAARPRGALRHDVGQQHGEAAVVVQPPHVDGARLLEVYQVISVSDVLFKTVFLLLNKYRRSKQ